jgi:hypothetical protein
MTSVTGVGTARGTLIVAGDPQFSGRVCLEAVDYPTSPPIDASQLVSTREGTCADVAAGRRAELPFAVHVRQQAYGRVEGRLHLVLTGANGRTTAAVVPFTFTMVRPVDTATRNELFVLLLAVGVVSPLVLLWVLGFRSAAFLLPGGVRAARLRVRVFPDGSLRRLEPSGEAPPFAFVEDDFHDAGIPPGRVRSFDWIDLRFDARGPLNPFVAPHGEVSVDGQFVTASEGVLRTRRSVTKGRVPLTLPGVWVFVLDPPIEQPKDVRGLDGTVTVFIAPGAPFAVQAPRVMHSLEQFFRELATRIHVGDAEREMATL